MTGRVPGPVAVPGTLMGQVCQPCHFGVTGRGGEGGQIGRHQLQVERTIPGEPGSGGHGTGVAGEPTGLLGTAAQVSAGRGRQPTVHVVQAASPSHGRHGGGQMAPTGMVIVDVIGRDNIGAQLTSELGQGVVAGTGQRLAMVPDLDGHIGPAEMALQAGQLVPGRGRAGIDQCPGHRTFSASRQYRPMIRATVTGPGRRRQRRGQRRLVRHGDGGEIEVGAGPDSGQEGKVQDRTALLPA